jgi:hypothetical protein
VEGQYTKAETQKKVSTPETYSIEAKKSGSGGKKVEGKGPQRQLQNKIHKGRDGHGSAACTGVGIQRVSGCENSWSPEDDVRR